MRYFFVHITVRRLTPLSRLQPEDRRLYPEHSWRTAWGDRAASAEAACEQALDWFHRAHAIECLDDFEITAKPVRSDGFASRS